MDFRRIADELIPSGADVRAYCVHRAEGYGSPSEQLSNSDTVWTNIHVPNSRADQLILQCDDKDRFSAVIKTFRRASQRLPSVEGRFLPGRLHEEDGLGRWLEFLFGLAQRPDGPVIDLDWQTWEESFAISGPGRDGLPSLFSQLVMPYARDKIRRRRHGTTIDEVEFHIPAEWEKKLPSHYFIEICDAVEASRTACDWLADRLEGVNQGKCGSVRGSKAKTPGKPGPKGPRNDPRTDERWYEQWTAARQVRRITYEEFERDRGCERDTVKDAVKRHQERRRKLQ